MNAKRCKELRSNLRQRGIDPRDVEYRRFRGRFGMPGTILLDPKCGRAIYRAAKKAGAV